MNPPGQPVDWCGEGPPPVIILCGGRSRRMGTDKTRLPLPGGTMYGRVESAFAAAGCPLIVVMGHDADGPPESERPRTVIRDAQPDLGPLEGMRAGLAAACDMGAELALVSTADAPLVQIPLYRFMVNRLHPRTGCLAAVPRVDDTWYPLTAVYRTAVLPDITRRVTTGQLRVKDLVNSIDTVKLTADELKRYDSRLQSLRNINTLDQYQQLHRELGTSGEPGPP